VFVEPQPESQKIYKKPLFYTSLAVFFGLIYLAWVFIGRWETNREFERRAAEKAAQQRAEDQRAVERQGGTRFEILSFYVTPSLIKRGESAQLCYGVSNTKTVRLDPAVESPMWPSLSRCIYVQPKKETTYTLTAEDAEGHSKTATVTLLVK
jgi:hypothetical protein